MFSFLPHSDTHSNTTLVKVKYPQTNQAPIPNLNSNTTLVKVKFKKTKSPAKNAGRIQIQHLLKLNARKINLYDFHYTIKSIDIQGF